MFFDDLLCTSEDFDQHIEHLENIFRRLNESNMTQNLEKSCFVKIEVQFLGYMIKNCVIKDKAKSESIMKFSIPRNTKQLKCLLSKCDYYQKFIRNYSNLI